MQDPTPQLLLLMMMNNRRINHKSVGPAVPDSTAHHADCASCKSRQRPAMDLLGLIVFAALLAFVVLATFLLVMALC